MSASPGRAARPMLAPITNLRVVAAVAVIAYHSWQHSGMTGMSWWWGGRFWEWLLVTVASAGVDGFFVVTAFLAGRGLVRAALGEGPATPVRRVLAGRAAALLPTYYVAVLLVWAMSNPRLMGHWSDLLLHLTFTQVYSDDFIFWTLGPAWFIAVAVHFYVLLAVLGGGLQRWCRRLATRRARLRVLLGSVGALTALCWAYKLVMRFDLHEPVTSWSTWFGPLSRLDLLAFGLLLAVVSAVRPAIPPSAVRGCYVAAAALTVLAGVVYSPAEPTWWGHSVAGVAAVCYLLPSVTDRRVGSDGGPVVVPAGGRPAPGWATGLATLTYGIYIWEEPVLRALDANGLLPPPSSHWAFPVTTVLMLGVTIGVAWLSYHLIETPGRAFVHWSARVERPAATAEPAPSPRLATAG